MKWANCAFHLSIHSQNHVPLVVSKHNCIFSLHIKDNKERPHIPSASSKNISCTQHPLHVCNTTYNKQDTYSTVTYTNKHNTQISHLWGGKKNQWKQNTVKTGGSASQYWTPISRPENNTDAWIGTSGK